MNLFGRGAAVGGGILLAVTLSACSGGGASPGGGSGSASPAPASSGSAIKDPKDASGDPCTFLPANGASAVGVSPQGKPSKDEGDGSPVCTWSGPNYHSLSFDVMPQGIESFNGRASSYGDFEQFAIAGHPAVRANEAKRGTADTCEIFVGTKNGQILHTQGAVAALNVGKEDPCQIAQHALEATVPNLPPAK